jgi:hypothetical protein
VNEIALWLQTPSGEEWSRSRHCDNGNVTRFSHGVFASLKNDHECHDCDGNPPRDRYLWLDKIIKQEITVYGMNGIPDVTQHPGQQTVPMLP